MKLADLARSNKDPRASPANIFTGQYIETAVSGPAIRQRLGFTCENVAHCHTGYISLHRKFIFLVSQITRGPWPTHLRLHLRMYMCW